jgi:hypothetical protein
LPTRWFEAHSVRPTSIRRRRGAARTDRGVCPTNRCERQSVSRPESTLLGEGPVDGGTDCVVPLRIEGMPHVVGENDVATRIRPELPLESPADWDERVSSPVHDSEGTRDPVGQHLRWIGRRPFWTDPDTHSPTSDPPAWPRASETHRQQRPQSEGDPPLGGTRDDDNSVQLGMIAGIAEYGNTAEGRTDQDRRHTPSVCPFCRRFHVQVLEMAQRVGAPRGSMAASVIGDDLEAARLETTSKCLDVRMILPRRQSVHEHDGGHRMAT